MNWINKYCNFGWDSYVDSGLQESSVEDVDKVSNMYKAVIGDNLFEIVAQYVCYFTNFPQNLKGSYNLGCLWHFTDVCKSLTKRNRLEYKEELLAKITEILEIDNDIYSSRFMDGKIYTPSNVEGVKLEVYIDEICGECGLTKLIEKCARESSCESLNFISEKNLEKIVKYLYDKEITVSSLANLFIVLGFTWVVEPKNDLDIGDCVLGFDGEGIIIQDGSKDFYTDDTELFGRF